MQGQEPQLVLVSWLESTLIVFFIQSSPQTLEKGKHRFKRCFLKIHIQNYYITKFSFWQVQDDIYFYNIIKKDL